MEDGLGLGRWKKRVRIDEGKVRDRSEGRVRGRMKEKG